MEASAQRVVAGAIEGAAQSPRHIQRQLSKLHEALTKAGPAIRDAIRAESDQTQVDVDVQFGLTLEFVAKCFADSDFERAIKTEYALARKENTPSNRAPYPVSYIVPATFNLVYSSVTPVAAAILAGSCVILELPKTLFRSRDLLQKTLLSTLDPATFTIVEKRLSLDALPKTTIRVFGSAQPGFSHSPSDLVPPATRSVAIVDRYADTREAAVALARAWFAFGGESPLAPEVVLVNDFRINEFCSLLEEVASTRAAASAEGETQIQAGQTTLAPGSTKPSTVNKARNTHFAVQELVQAEAKVVLSSDRFGVFARIDNRTSPLLKKTLPKGVRLIVPVRSIDDAIDRANSFDDSPLASLSIFGPPEVAKYSSQFVDAHICCANNIPVELLVAPLPPIGFPATLHGPYSKEVFSLPKPGFISFSARSTRLCAVLDTSNADEAGKIRNAAEAIDTQYKQPAGYTLGFFESNILLGLAVTLTMVGTSSAFLIKYGIRYAVPAIGKFVQPLR